MRTIEWHNRTVVTIDQTKLPSEEVFITIKSPEEMAEAIKTMKIRGAPLLGAAAAYALALAACNSKAANKEELLRDLESSAEIIRRTRPTAVNLFWALDRILKKTKTLKTDRKGLAAFVVEEANRIADEDATANKAMGKYGAELIKDGDVILTHCNAGALACVEYGTALGVVRAAWEQGKRIKVISSETRPLLQGARLSVYEMKKEGIPVTLITDNMVGYVMSKKMVNKVIVGADRIVRDAVINKIGTYGVAILAKEHKVPFYVAAPTSTFDLTRTAKEVVIEERNPEEVTHIGSKRITVEGVNVLNPAFDITPFKYVTAVISEKGILKPESFRKNKTNR
ncbi:MAG TPA: S-methyl-5-thioribose-1-phosphate isomerase [Patescibacteria group bacterium]|nr:S-methyl-5-thioribose-1-phosphate isomerase [Patescibacteria group bacterium]